MERERVFLAMDIMKKTSLEEGVCKYGKSFRSLDYLIRKHQAAVLDPWCDIANQGPGMWSF